MTFSWSTDLESRAPSNAGTHVHHGTCPRAVVDALFRIPRRNADRLSGSSSPEAVGIFLPAPLLPRALRRANPRPSNPSLTGSLGSGADDFTPGAERPHHASERKAA